MNSNYKPIIKLIIDTIATIEKNDKNKLVVDKINVKALKELHNKILELE